MEIKCSNCGELYHPGETDSSMEFCPKCGMVLAGIDKDYEEKVENTSPINNEKILLTQKTAWFGIAVLCLVGFFGNFMGYFISMSFYKIRDGLGVESSRIGLIWSVSCIAYGIFLIPGGILADRFKRIWIVAIFSLLSAMSIFMTGFCKTFEQVLFLRAVDGLSGALVASAFITLLFDYAPQKLLNRIYALYIITIAIGSSGSFLTNNIISTDYSRDGWRHLFWIFGAIEIAFFMLLFFIKEPQRGANNYAVESEDIESKSENKTRIVFWNPAMIWVFCGAVIFYIYHEELFSNVFKYIDSVYGIAPMDVTTKYMPFGMLFAYIAFLVSARYADILNKKISFISHYLILGGMVTSVPFFLIFINSQNALWIPLSLFPFILLVQLAVVPFMVLLLTSVRHERRGLLYGVFLFFTSFVLKALPSLFIERITDTYNKQVAISLFVLIFISIAAACMIAAIRAEKKAMRLNGV